MQFFETNDENKKSGLQTFFKKFSKKKQIQKNSPLENYEQNWEIYGKIVEKNTVLAEKLLKNGAPLDTLAVTPITEWHHLEKIQKLELMHSGKIQGKKYQIFQNGIQFIGRFDEENNLVFGQKNFPEIHTREE